MEGHHPPALHQAECGQEAEEGNPSLHGVGNTCLALAFQAQCWAPQWRLRHIGESPSKRLQNLRQFTKMVKGLEHMTYGKRLKEVASFSLLKRQILYEGPVGSLPLPTWRLSNFMAEGQGTRCYNCMQGKILFP